MNIELKFIENLCHSEGIHNMSGAYFVDLSRVRMYDKKTKQIRISFTNNGNYIFLTFAYDPLIALSQFVLEFKQFLKRNIDTIRGVR